MFPLNNKSEARDGRDIWMDRLCATLNAAP